MQNVKLNSLYQFDVTKKNFKLFLAVISCETVKGNAFPVNLFGCVEAALVVHLGKLLLHSLQETDDVLHSPWL